ncbi:G1 family glutamic endopeptidase [Kitasatospora viridis]|uniref:Carbohydrate binding protein n=1 Tax=Kitasatospora viridis TaxID=281105 RepID=A0A561SED9_9ACTN|nr:G1 family glutamic endopeptidase [Kitasatospora viridis]TWF73226.1 carbohydrate binding protein [Kitasatospora viridis]
MRRLRSLSVAAVALAVVFGGGATAQAASAAPPAVHHAAHGHALPGATSVPVRNLQHFSHLLNARHQLVPANQTSTNWAGYAANGATFSTVTSSWVEPQVSCNSDGIAAFWIGLDGWGSQSVEQDGTGVDCSSGSPQPFAWWETYPDNSVQEYGDPVSPGDSLTSTVTARSDGQYELALTDSSQGWTEDNVVAAPSGAQNASAEVVAEAVTSGSSVTALPDFGSIEFTGSTIDGGTLQAANAQAIDMTDSSGSVIASTGADDNSGDFTVTYGGGSGNGGNPPPAGCGGLAAWSATSSYAPGAQVSYNGDKWTATWYSTGAAPGAAGSWAAWKQSGTC